MTVHRVICDCDNTMGVPGKPVDDGQTILYLLGRPDIDLVGITTTFGNGTIDEVYGATAWLLRTLGREDIPLFKGAGARGEAPGNAARFLADMAARYPGEISVLAIGPLGNLHAAAEIDPAFFRNVKQISIMGGYFGPLKGAYWQKVPELNLSRDPEAAYAVFHAPCPVTLMNANVCQQAPFGLRELERMSTWRGTPIYQTLHDWVLQCEIDEGLPGDYLWDLLPAVYLSYPELFDENRVWLQSSVADLETGTLVLGERGEGAEVNMPSQIRDVGRFYEILYDAWACAPKSTGSARSLR
ncbi:MAG: nucleoside hydrolase [Anaerolineae bacterium]